ncbi:MAG TPA: signal peptidase I [Nitrososphaeraceae archaeon]|nr:signal peptidase I [Nitrososphaeraceae archaeon]
MICKRDEKFSASNNFLEKDRTAINIIKLNIYLTKKSFKNINLLNKKESNVPSAIKDIVIVVIGVAIVWLGIRFVFDTGNPFYVVSSGSMIPVLNVNDILVVRDGHSFDSLKVGEIIVFHRPEGGDRVIVHRVAEISTGSHGDRIIRTKGDANAGSIPGTDYPIIRNDYIGRVVYVIPQAGLITKAISPPVNYIIIAIIIGILILSKVGKNRTGDDRKSRSTTDSANDSFQKPPPSK